MGRDIIARGMASGAIKVNINAGHVFVDNTARDAYFITNPTELVENMYVYCNSKLQQYDGSIWIDRTPAIKGETGTGVPTGGTTNQVLTKNSNGDYDFSWVDLTSAYSIIKQALAEDGYIATYQLTKNGTPLGSKINIPKDYLVKSGTLETCSQNDIPVSGYIIGDKYLDFIVNTTENTGNQTHIYIKVTDLIDIYTEGNGIDITNNSISVVINSVSNGLFVNSGGVGLNLATSNSNGAFSSGEKTKLNNIKKSIIAETTASLLTANWVGSVAPYTIDVVLAIPDYTVTSDNDLNIYPIYNSNQTTAQSEMEAYSYLSRGEIISDNTIRFTCYNRKPAVNLNINIEIFKKFT